MGGGRRGLVLDRGGGNLVDLMIEDGIISPMPAVQG